MSGLAVVAVEGGERGLVPVDKGTGDSGLGVSEDENDLPVTSVNSVGLGFHELRWKLFFLRTLARYAARIAAVASEGLMQHELAEVMLGARAREGDEVVISRRGSGGGEARSAKGDDGGDGEVDEHVS